MSHEPLANIFPVCRGCNDERQAETQEVFAAHNVQPNDLIGFYVKLKFGTPTQHEYMWVKVLQIGKQEDLVGQLSNDPVIATEWKDGDWLEFDMAEIIEVLIES